MYRKCSNYVQNWKAFTIKVVLYKSNFTYICICDNKLDDISWRHAFGNFSGFNRKIWCKADFTWKNNNIQLNIYPICLIKCNTTKHLTILVDKMQPAYKFNYSFWKGGAVTVCTVTYKMYHGKAFMLNQTILSNATS